jgi:hypothetical protein
VTVYTKVAVIEMARKGDYTQYPGQYTKALPFVVEQETLTLALDGPGAQDLLRALTPFLHEKVVVETREDGHALVTKLISARYKEIY